jgi:hypothetical protein
VFESRHPVATLANKVRGARDPVLPVDARFVLPSAVRLPNGDAGVWRRGGEIENSSSSSRFERRPKFLSRSRERLSAAMRWPGAANKGDHVRMRNSRRARPRTIAIHD